MKSPSFSQKMTRFPRFFKRKNEPYQYQYFKYYKIISEDEYIIVYGGGHDTLKMESTILSWCFSKDAEEIMEAEAVLL